MRTMSTLDRMLPIAMFDSGVGGLTVLHECLVSLPHEDFLYFGDTARFPYGDRGADQLVAFSLEIADRLVEEGAKLIVVACNSATSAALNALEDSLRETVPVVGVVTPESALAANATTTNQIGLLATPATVASGAYDRAVAAAAPDATLTSVASSQLAPLIQAGGAVDHEIVDCVESACAPLREADVDTVILGCTHYPIVRPVLQRALGRGVTIVSSGQAIADAVESTLSAVGATNEESRRGTYSFMCSGDPDAFAAAGARFLQMPLGEVRHVDVAPAREAAA